MILRLDSEFFPLFKSSQSIKAEILDEIQRRLRQRMVIPFDMIEFPERMAIGETRTEFLCNLTISNLSRFIPIDVVEWHQVLFRVGGFSNPFIEGRVNSSTDSQFVRTNSIAHDFWLTWIAVMRPGAYLKNFSSYFVSFVLSGLTRENPLNVEFSRPVKMYARHLSSILSAEAVNESSRLDERLLIEDSLRLLKLNANGDGLTMTIETVFCDLLLALSKSHPSDARRFQISVESALQNLIILASKLSWDRSLLNIQISYECIWHYAKQRLKEDPSFDFLGFVNNSSDGKAFNDPEYQQAIIEKEKLVRDRVLVLLFHEFVRCIEFVQDFPLSSSD